MIKGKWSTVAIGAVVVVLVAAAVATWAASRGSFRNLWLTPNQQAQRSFEHGDYSAAAQQFEDRERQGVALFRDGQFEQSAAAFARSNSPEAAFNRGNALVMLGKYDEAIASYDRALVDRPAWAEAAENRQLAAARRDRLAPPEDDAGGTDGQLGADEIVFDNRAKNSAGQEQVEVGEGEKLSEGELQALWLQRVQTKPADFLRAKFAYQSMQRDAAPSEEEEPEPRP